MNKETMILIRVFKLKNKMSSLEKEAFLSDLIGGFFSEPKSCKSLEYLINNDFEGFQEYAKFLNEQGEQLRRNLLNWPEEDHDL